MQTMVRDDMNYDSGTAGGEKAALTLGAAALTPSCCVPRCHVAMAIIAPCQPKSGMQSSLT